MSNTPQKPRFIRFSVGEQIIFFKRLAMILRSGIPLREGLKMLESNNNSRSHTYILLCIINDVSRGTTLSAALSPFFRVFGILSINMIRVGEASGTLHQNLMHLSNELKKKEALKKKVLGALIYPAVIVCATIGISGVLTVYIFPKIMPIFASFRQHLPLSTRMLIALSGFLIKDTLWVLLFFIVIAISMIFLWRMPPVKYRVERVILALPLLGKLSRYYNLANMMRTTSLLLNGDVRIVQALEIVSRSCLSSVYREALEVITLSVTRGKRLSVELEHNPTLFPPLLSQMIASGEETGDLSASLMYVADMYEEEINDLTANLTVLVEPVLMIVMGLVVGFIAISIITPIYGITQNLTPR